MKEASPLLVLPNTSPWCQNTGCELHPTGEGGACEKPLRSSERRGRKVRFARRVHSTRADSFIFALATTKTRVITFGTDRCLNKTQHRLCNLLYFFFCLPCLRAFLGAAIVEHSSCVLIWAAPSRDVSSPLDAKHPVRLAGVWHLFLRAHQCIIETTRSRRGSLGSLESRPPDRAAPASPALWECDM